MKVNNCKKCPYHGSYFNSFIGDGDEWCECGIVDDWGVIEGCKYPLFIRHILAYINRKRQEKWDKEAESNMLKEEERKAYKCLNLSEDIYLILLETAEELESVYGRETELTRKIRGVAEKIEQI